MVMITAILTSKEKENLSKEVHMVIITLIPINCSSHYTLLYYTQRITRSYIIIIINLSVAQAPFQSNKSDIIRSLYKNRTFHKHSFSFFKTVVSQKDLQLRIIQTKNKHQQTHNSVCFSFLLTSQ